ncbi:hypothetical protein KKC94_02210 [Patescibacteria group bacterium]|nr:hypothetical protein [Patescibacteria group bacterium]
MAFENPEIPKLDKSLQEQLKKSVEDGKTSINKRIDIVIGTYERGLSTKNTLESIFLKKSAEVYNLVQEIRKKDIEAHTEKTPQWYLEKQQALMNSLILRFDLMLSMAGNQDKKISNLEELATFVEKQFKLLQNLDTTSLLESVGISPESLGREIPKDYIQLISKLSEGKEPTQGEWTRMENEMRELISHSSDNPAQAYQRIKTYRAFAFLDVLSESQRLTLLSKILDTQGAQKLISNLVLTRYITPIQGEQLCKDAISRFPKRAGEFQIAMQSILSEKMQSDIKTFSDIRKQAVENLQRAYHQNLAGKLLSVEGIVGWFVIKNVALWTGIANLPLVLQGDYANPAFWGSVGVFAAAVDEYTGGIGHGITTRRVSEALQGKAFTAEVNVQKQSKIESDTVTMLSLNRPITEFYYHNADRIAGQVQRNEKNGKPLTDFTLEDLGIQYESLSEKYRHIPKEKLETEIKQIAAILYRTENGMGKKDGNSQKIFINESLDAQGVSQIA